MDLHWIFGSHWMKVSNSPLLSPENPCLQKAISLSCPGFSGLWMLVSGRKKHLTKVYQRMDSNWDKTSQNKGEIRHKTHPLGGILPSIELPTKWQINSFPFLKI